MFTLIKPSTENAKLDLEGGIYVLEKLEGNWTVKGSRNVNDNNKKIDSSNFTTMFPSVGSTLGLSGNADVGTN